MLMRCADLSGLTSNRESRQRKAIGGASVSVDISSQFKDFSLNSQSSNVSVKIIHAGGRVERHPTAFPASLIMEKYPGMCVARPEVFRKPHECILSAGEVLLPGQKYYILPCTTARKLARKHHDKAESKTIVADEEKVPEKRKVDVDADADPGEETGESSICSARDFYVSNDRWLSCSLTKKAIKRKPFTPPIPRLRMLRQLAWEPSLSSVQELSP